MTSRAGMRADGAVPRIPVVLSKTEKRQQQVSKARNAGVVQEAREIVKIGMLTPIFTEGGREHPCAACFRRSS